MQVALPLINIQVVVVVTIVGLFASITLYGVQRRLNLLNSEGSSSLNGTRTLVIKVQVLIHLSPE